MAPSLQVAPQIRSGHVVRLERGDLVSVNRPYTIACLQSRDQTEIHEVVFAGRQIAPAWAIPHCRILSETGNSRSFAFAFRFRRRDPRMTR
jgi:hypothetical protein